MRNTVHDDPSHVPSSEEERPEEEYLVTGPGREEDSVLTHSGVSRVLQEKVIPGYKMISTHTSQSALEPQSLVGVLPKLTDTNNG